ncbi:unnamed protein product, partial [Phaeothamnion confervicola]
EGTHRGNRLHQDLLASVTDAPRVFGSALQRKDRRSRLYSDILASVADSPRFRFADVGGGLRVLDFWRRSAEIYFSYKAVQMTQGLKAALFPKTDASAAANEEEWERLHELNSDRMLALCLDLRGFYLKAGQFLAMRHDFLPSPYCQKLSQLHDRTPFAAFPCGTEVARSSTRSIPGAHLPWAK